MSTSTPAPSQAEIARIVEEVVRRVVASGAAGGGGEHKCGCDGGPKSGECDCDGKGRPAASAATAPAPAVTDSTKANRAALERGACRVGGCPGDPGLLCDDLAPYIDHTLLKADATLAEVAKLCEEARAHHFASVCVNTSYVEEAAQRLKGSGVMVCCVVGFPLGAMTSDSKAFETRDAVGKGADEVDMVINVGRLRAGDFAFVYDDIRAVVKAAQGRPVKVILETSLLDDDQKMAACVLSKAAGAAFVKTSTGFSTGGATPEDVALMRRIVGEGFGVKASGGIRDCDIAKRMVDAGADRLGASASVGIVEGKGATKSGY